MNLSGTNGILNVYKEKGYTSHDVVNIVRKLFGRAKTGHTGTLDPNAEGVLPICIGKATKIADYLVAETKAYRGVVNLGKTTDTDDETGTILQTREVTASQSEITKVLIRFRGEISQIPPMYSAIKQNGKKLYDIARTGETVERKARNITVYDISISEFLSHEKFIIDVVCSKGTYIRSICRDIGEMLGCGGNMGDLTRTRAGIFKLENSLKLAEIKEEIENQTILDYVLKIDDALSYLPSIHVGAHLQKLLENGNEIDISLLEIESFDFDKALVYDHNKRLVGIFTPIKKDGQTRLKPATMLL